MQQNIFQSPVIGGFVSELPQNPQNAAEAVNLTVDDDTGGWSTRIGYEPFRPGRNDWDPFSSVGPIYGLHAAQELATGARQHILFEADGDLYLAYDASGSLILRTLATGRNIPAPTESGPWFTDTAYGTVITNGVDRPVLVRPWPLGNASESSSSIASCIRPFGFDTPAPAVDPYRVAPMEQGTTVPDNAGGGGTTIWCPTYGQAIGYAANGLGFARNLTSDPGNENLFGWAVAFVSDTGSEGPRSPLSAVGWDVPTLSDGQRHAVALSLPTGPEGTVARKVYRTANYSNDGPATNDTTVYFIDIVRNNDDDLFFDAVKSADLGNPAPIIPTGPLPAPRARFSAIFDGCLFLDGGIDDPYTIYFSEKGLIEQYRADAYLELPSQGGSVTALYNNYTNLLVFREQGIDVVEGNAAAGFRVTTLSANVSCKSPKTIQAVPGIGVMFLATDGIYVITGGLQGGASVDVIKLTDAQDSIISRITPDCFPRAVAAYSPNWREYHVYFPVDGNDRPNRGMVFHLKRAGQVEGGLSPWTVREGFPVGDITALANGSLVFGHNTGVEAGAGTENEKGLFVISGRRALGKAADGDTLIDADPPTSRWRSAWNAFGDPKTKKQVSYVILNVLTTGDPTITVRHYKDFSLTATSERSYKAQPPDAADLPVYDTVTLGSNTYQDARLATIRVPVAHMSCSWFSFEVETTEDLIFIGYECIWTTKGTPTIKGKRA